MRHGIHISFPSIDTSLSPSSSLNADNIISQPPPLNAPARVRGKHGCSHRPVSSSFRVAAPQVARRLWDTSQRRGGRDGAARSGARGGRDGAACSGARGDRGGESCEAWAPARGRPKLSLLPHGRRKSCLQIDCNRPISWSHEIRFQSPSFSTQGFDRFLLFLVDW
jgi:hypothetical protein